MNHAISLIAACIAATAALASVYFAGKTGQARRKADGYAQPCMPACYVCWAPARWRPTAGGGMKTLCDDHADSQT